MSATATPTVELTVDEFEIAMDVQADVQFFGGVDKAWREGNWKDVMPRSKFRYYARM